MKQLNNFIAGKEKQSDSDNVMDVYTPLTGETIAQLTLSDKSDLDEVVLVASESFKLWSSTPIKQRVQVLYVYKILLEKHKDELAKIIQQENGKVYPEAVAEIDKAIEVVEFACSLSQIATGEVLEVGRGVECKSEHLPLGVVACITPFNFPSMVPHWTIPIVIALGNTMILKPSEQVPISALHIARLLKESGLPDGVFNVVQGDKNIVEAICDHPEIKAVSFVGSTPIAKLVYARATAQGKRALALGGAKNHLVVLPDAHVEMTASNIVASMTGCAGQRCMAASALVSVTKNEEIIQALCEKAKALVPGENVGSVISLQAKERIERMITEAEAAGARILVDGRNVSVKGKENGWYVGPTVIDQVTPDMAIAREEVFGPVLSILYVDTIDEAVAIENDSAYGNGASIFTQNGAHAKELSSRLSSGMIGINIGVPVPREPFSFGGINASKFGVGDITGKSSIAFWTQIKKITTKWNPEAFTNWMS